MSCFDLSQKADDTNLLGYKVRGILVQVFDVDFYI